MMPLELFRGDSWQLLVINPGDALRVALFLRAYLRAETRTKQSDTRFAIGVGTVEEAPSESIRENRGEAYEHSGALLDKKSSQRMHFGIAREHLDGWYEEKSITAILAVLDVVASRWSSAQSRAICGALTGGTQEQIAKEWHGESISQQAVGQHLSRAGWVGVEAAVQYYEEIMNNWEPS